MNTTILVASIPALTTLTNLATLGVSRRGASLRMKMPGDVMSAATEQSVAVQLLAAGATMQVLKGDVVWTPSLAPDGTVVWSKRSTPKTRKHTTVVVSL